ncbi:MAG TPA: TIR domain-containing protein [Casimicrobiaceae bacterium]|nr:TIR domain-containing protein [Casimicrobiaceae bacterium]
MDVRNKVFISYAHEDDHVAGDLRKHLTTRLRSEASVWIDTELKAGDKWEATLNGALNSSNCALLLLSVDFLSSEYIMQHELPRILREGERGLRIMPVLVRDCAWANEPSIAKLQLALPPKEPLSAMMERSKSEYESAIESVCKIVADQLGQLGKQSRGETIKAVPELLSSIDGLELLVALHGGDSSIVYRGKLEGRDVAVKLMLNRSLSKFTDQFNAALGLARELEHHCFIPLLYSKFESGSPAVLILPWVDSRQLSEQIASNPPSIDKAACFLRRAAEALSLLHDRGGLYGIMTTDNVYVEEELEIIRFPAISILGFLSGRQGWNRFVGDKPDAATYLIPEQFYGAPMSAKSDQYALAQLALEMLCGAPPVAVNSPADFEKKRRFFESPEEFVRETFPQATWPDDHPKLGEVLFRMLQPDPRDRWPRLQDVVRELGNLEEEARALAKTVYMDLETSPDFFVDFYARFFDKCEGARKKFHGLDMKAQAEKLKDAMIAVLNFREGAEPTTLHGYIAVHVKVGVTIEELNAFEECLIECLKLRYPDHKKKVAAWSKLLPPVMEYMRRNCTIARA